MKILVTGGAGFIGTNLINKMLDYHDVYSIDNYSTGSKSNELNGCVYYDLDIREIKKIDLQFDIIYHLAAKARIQPSFEIPQEYIENNFLGTYEVVKYCVDRNIPLVYGGSSSKHSGKFSNPYTFSKDLGEDIICLYQKHYGLKASIARFYNVYGPYQILNGPYTTLIGRWLNNIANNIECVVYGDGYKRRDFTHVEDIVEALIAILEKQAWGYDFELGRGFNYSINEVAEMFGIKPKYLEAKPGEADVTLNVDTLAKNVLEWFPKRNLPEYLQKELKRIK